MDESLKPQRARRDTLRTLSGQGMALRTLTRELASAQGGSDDDSSGVRSLHFVHNCGMPISARNKLRGKIEEIQLGDIMAHVVLRVGDNLIESAITRRSAEELQLKKGDTVSAAVKATEVMIQKD